MIKMKTNRTFCVAISQYIVMCLHNLNINIVEFDFFVKDNIESLSMSICISISIITQD